MGKKMYAGSGLLSYCVNREEQKITLDFSGNDETGCCFRNDASILFFDANSYKSAFLCIDRELAVRFQSNSEKDIAHLVLPYYFNFRHYVELALKAIIVGLTDESPKITHSLDSLMKEVCKCVEALEYDNETPPLFNNPPKFEKSKAQATSICDILKSKISEYSQIEYVDEYYRYIFEKDKSKGLVLNHAEISLDFPSVHSLFIEIRDLLDKLCVNLRDMTYIFFTV